MVVYHTLIAVAALMLAACNNTQEKLRQRAAELCQYIPDHVLLESSKDYMTNDFYAVLDTMFNLPEHEAMDHEWLHYFVTGNGGTIADFEVVKVELNDPTHATATVNVRQKWEDGSFAEDSDVEEHALEMEKVDGVWLMSDFDGHKADCIRHIDINRREQARRDAISDYLVSEVAPHYLQGELCIPSLMIVSTEEPSEASGQEADSASSRVWCDCWVFWYNVAGDTLKTVSGGNHSGLMTLRKADGRPVVASFEQTTDGAGFTASAKQIFGPHYEMFQSMHANEDVREDVRQEQLRQYIRRHGLKIRYLQDYGWDAVDLLP
ncbi:MAG: hypothetical protein IJR87_00990 [Bacteroidaceae bacterium]|nr:hypothetical protein [Bacteroidaceae bacterium]